MKILALSNGHGEDVIAVRILEELMTYANAPELAALPLVGAGDAYTQIGVPIVGKVQKMPSGGFIYMDGRQLWGDIQGGLLQLTLEQYKLVRQWGKTGCFILAVGDLVPLLFAWLSGANYAFVGTAKSEYYVRDEREWLPTKSLLERYFGSVYFPWERSLMSNSRCQAVFPRDSLTTEVLKKWSIPAFDLGNPMMDKMTKASSHRDRSPDSLIVMLLPGSRMPEADRNWRKIIDATSGVMSSFPEQKIFFLAAIASALDLEPFSQYLITQGWHSQSIELLSSSLPIDDLKALVFTNEHAILILTQNAYADCSIVADVAIAMAGTATEQFVGLGKPAITIPGEGPQFNYLFAEAQSRLLGKSVTLVSQPDLVGMAIASILTDPAQMQFIAENGKRRMGTPGAASRIAKCLMELDRSDFSKPKFN